jgi:protein phosphatase
MKPTGQPDTDEFVEPIPSSDIERPGPVSSAVQVEIAARSHQGHVRSNNEDHYLVVRGERALQTLLTNLPEGAVPMRFAEVGYGMLVADGMGGRAAGEVASQITISTLVNLVLNTPDWIMRLGDQEVSEMMRRMTARFRRLNDVLHQEAELDPHLKGMGTTLTLTYSLGPDLILAHAGDSRCYLLRGAELHQLTCDHTMAQAMANLGIIRPEEAATHRLRHVLTNVLGGELQVEVQVKPISLAHDDQVLLCTDGLTEMVDEATIAAVLRDASSAEDACQSLVDRALTNGGKDNVTVVLARYRFPKDLR